VVVLFQTQFLSFFLLGTTNGPGVTRAVRICKQSSASVKDVHGIFIFSFYEFAEMNVGEKDLQNYYPHKNNIETFSSIIRRLDQKKKNRNTTFHLIRKDIETSLSN
jgi:hypothetical protein